MAKLADIEGIGPAIEKKLNVAGIRSTKALLEHGGTAKGRKELAEATGLDEGRLLELVNHADLYRISGVGSEYSDLLEEAGVDTVRELAQRVPVKLYEKMIAVNREKSLVRKLPSVDQIESWVKQAKSLPRAVKY